MLVLLITVILGTILAVFATYNTSQVSLNVPFYGLVSMPVYIAVIIPLILGLALAYGVHILRGIAYKMTIRKLKGQIKDLKKELTEVRKDAHKFELESAKIKAENGEPEDDNSI